MGLAGRGAWLDAGKLFNITTLCSQIIVKIVVINTLDPYHKRLLRQLLGIFFLKNQQNAPFHLRRSPLVASKAPKPERFSPHPAATLRPSPADWRSFCNARFRRG
jgi:hypothetical protein